MLKSVLSTQQLHTTSDIRVQTFIAGESFAGQYIPYIGMFLSIMFFDRFSFLDLIQRMLSSKLLHFQPPSRELLLVTAGLMGATNTLHIMILPSSRA